MPDNAGLAKWLHEGALIFLPRERCEPGELADNETDTGLSGRFRIRKSKIKSKKNTRKNINKVKKIGKKIKKIIKNLKKIIKN
jgi:hypothetical protein